MKFNDYFPSFIAAKRYVVKTTTIAAYELLWRVHLSRYFGEIEVENIKNSICQKYVENEIANGRAIKPIKDSITLLKTVIKQYCIVNDLPLISPIVVWPTSAKLGKAKREKFNDDEITAIVDYCKASEKHWVKLVALSALTGGRIGEMCGLQFGDFDFSNHTIHIQRTVGRIYNNDKKTELYVNTPKTVNSERVVPIPIWLSQYYKTYKSLYRKNDDDFITSGTFEKMPFVEPRTLRVGFKSICKSIGIPYKPFHCLRHTYISRLLIKGVDPRTVAELVGHSDVAMTLNIYGHSDNSVKQAAVKKIFI